MVERRPVLTVLTHLLLLLGVMIVAFPVYLAWVASTHTAQDIVQVPMPMVPGSNFWQTYHDALFGGGTGAGSTAPVARMMWVSLVTASVIAVGKTLYPTANWFADPLEMFDHVFSEPTQQLREQRDWLAEELAAEAAEGRADQAAKEGAR